MRAYSSTRGVMLITALLIAWPAAMAKAAPSIEHLVQRSAAGANSKQRGFDLERDVEGTANDWSVGLAGGLPNITVWHFARRNPDDRDELRILPIINPVIMSPVVSEANELRIAQRADSPLIIMPSAITGDPGSVVAVPIRIDSKQALHEHSYVRLSGVPQRFTLNVGNQVEHAWVVALHRLPNLQLNIPTDASGESEIVVTLVDIDGTVLRNAKTLLVIRPAPIPPTRKTPTPAEGPDRNRFLAQPVQLSIEEKKRAEQLVAQGEKYLADQNIDVARQFFLRAADMGLAAAAFRLAATYDPAELAGMNVVGVVSDPEEARKWYERARQLGLSEAEIRLARFPRN